MWTNFSLRLKTEFRGTICQRVDNEIMKTMTAFHDLMDYRNLHLLGPKTIVKLDDVCQDMKHYVKTLIDLSNSFGFESDDRRYLLHVYKHRKLRNDDFIDVIESYFRDIVLTYIDRQIDNFPDKHFTNLSLEKTTIASLYQMTFNPLIFFMKQQESDLKFVLESIVSSKSDFACEKDWENRSLDVQHIKHLFDLEFNHVRRVSEDWLSHWLFIVGKDTILNDIQNNPFDVSFDLYSSIHKNVVLKMRRLKGKSIQSIRSDAVTAATAYHTTVARLKKIPSYRF